MQLSIIIVSYNVKYFLEQCLCSVDKAIEKIEAEIFVVDNNSSDDSIAYLRGKFSDVIFIENSNNVGFSKANNSALYLCKGEYILFLNPDTIVTENTFAECIHFLNENSNAGAVGIKLIDGSGNFLPESKRSFPSPLTSFFKLSGLAALSPKSHVLNKYALGYLDENKMHEVDVLVGAFLMARKSVLLDLKGFDEDFFMYGEDIDLSYRVIKAGYKNYYLGNCNAVHFKGESTKKDSVKYVHQFYNAMTIFVNKHYKQRKLNAYLLKASIKASTILIHSGIKVRKSLKLLHSKKEKQFLQTILLGGETDTESALKILLQHKTSNHIQSIQSADQAKKSEGAELIFCMGELSYAASVEFMEKNKNKYHFKFHGKNSGSIAGSDFKNKSGEIYT